MKKEEEKKDAVSSKPDSHKESTAYKNKVFKYKDGSTSRVTYDAKEPNYIEIKVGN